MLHLVIHMLVCPIPVNSLTRGVARSWQIGRCKKPFEHFCANGMAWMARNSVPTSHWPSAAKASTRHDLVQSNEVTPTWKYPTLWDTRQVGRRRTTSGTRTQYPFALAMRVLAQWLLEGLRARTRLPISSIARAHCPVLITTEPGMPTRNVARYLHQPDGRSRCWTSDHVILTLATRRSTARSVTLSKKGNSR